MDYGCQNVTILFTEKKHTIDFRERTGAVESFEYGHDRRRNRFGSSLYYKLYIYVVFIFFTLYFETRHTFNPNVRSKSKLWFYLIA